MRERAAPRPYPIRRLCQPSLCQNGPFPTSHDQRLWSDAVPFLLVSSVRVVHPKIVACRIASPEQAVQTGAKSCVVRVWMLCEWQRGEEERWKAGFGRKTHCLPATPIVQHLRSPVSPCLASVCRCCMRPETLGLPFMALCVKLRD
jgi:hypothetical protein